MSSQIQFPSIVMSSDIDAVVEGILIAALKGVRVFVTEGVKETFKDLFRDLGIELREYTGALPETCILIREHSQRVIIEIYESGNRIHTVSTTTKRFAKSLENIVKKKKGDVSQVYFEMIIPKELAEVLKNIVKQQEEVGDE